MKFEDYKEFFENMLPIKLSNYKRLLNIYAKSYNPHTLTKHFSDAYNKMAGDLIKAATIEPKTEDCKKL